jgi:hypothetical protein
VKRHRAEFAECLLLEVEPSFLPDTSPPLEALFLPFHIYFSDSVPGPREDVDRLNNAVITMLNATR